MNALPLVFALLLGACAVTPQVETSASNASPPVDPKYPCTRPPVVLPQALSSMPTVKAARAKLQVEVFPSGAVGAVVILQSSGHRALDDVAIENLRALKCNFFPPRTGPVLIVTDYTFNID
jgi:TonB family protein